MADTTIAAKITVDTGAATNSVRSFTSELKTAKQEVIAITEQFGPMSKEAAAAAQKVAGLQDAIGDAKQLVDAFNPDTKFKAFGATINTVVGGFSALQGVLGLVGAESEDVQKALLKVQSALAISQGISQLQEGIKSFQNLGAVIQATTLFQKANNIVTAIATAIMRALGISTTATAGSMTVLKTAIIATGIGALVVLLGVAADAMGLFGDATDEAAEAQARLKTQIELANAQLEGEVAFLANEEKLDIARAKSKGASESEIFAIQQRYRRLRFQSLTDAYNEIAAKDSEQGIKLLQQLNELNTEGQVAELEHQGKLAEIREAAAKKAEEERKKARQKELDERAKELEAEAARFTARGGAGVGLGINIPKTPEQIALENEIAARNEARIAREEYDMFSADSAAKATEIHLRNVNERIAADQAEQAARQVIADAYISALGSIADLVGRNTRAGKILALAEIAAGTAKGFINALVVAQTAAAGTGPGAAVAFPIFYATQIAAVLAAAARAKSILSSGGTGAASPTASVPNAPLVPKKPVQGSTTLDQQSLNALNNATTRSFVLEADVTSNQERITRLNRAARLA